METHGSKLDWAGTTYLLGYSLHRLPLSSMRFLLSRDYAIIQREAKPSLPKGIVYVLIAKDSVSNVRIYSVPSFC